MNKLPNHSLKPPTKVVPFTTKSQTFEVSIFLEARLANVVLRNTRTNRVLRRGTYYPRIGHWSWDWMPKGVNLPPHIQNFAQEQVMLFISTFL